MNTATLDKLFPYNLVNKNKNLKTYQGIQISKPLCLPRIPSLSCWLYEKHYKYHAFSFPKIGFNVSKNEFQIFFSASPFGINHALNSKVIIFALTSTSSVCLCRNGDWIRSSVVSLVGMMLSFGERVSILVDQLFTATGCISHGECSKGVIAGVSDGEVLSLELDVFSKS